MPATPPIKQQTRYGSASFEEVCASVREVLDGGRGLRLVFAGATPRKRKEALIDLTETTALNVHQFEVPHLLSERFAATQGNLREVFDTADEGPASLLFFEKGDAFFDPEQLSEERKEKEDELTPLDYFLQRAKSFKGALVLSLDSRRHAREAHEKGLEVLVEF